MNCKICENTSAKNNSVSFFRFPKENDRCKDWAERCNLLSLLEKYGTLRFYKSFRICSDHFEPKDIIFDGRKNRLLQSAVPKNFLNCKILKNNDDDASSNTLTHNEIFKLKLVENLCRLCAEENRNLTDIFGWRGKILNLENKLKFFPLIVNKYDVLPVRICHQCISKINQFCDFITNCIKAETKLRIMLDVQNCDSECKLLDSNDNLTESFFIKSNTSEKNETLSEAGSTIESESPASILNCGDKLNVEQNLSMPYATYTQAIDSDNVEFFRNESQISKAFSVLNQIDDINSVDFNKNVSFQHDHSNIILREQISAKDKILSQETQQQNFSEPQNLCDISAKTFPRVDAINTHTTFHFFKCDDDKEFTCKFCKLKFSNSYYLQEHIYTHTGEKTFKCQICFKTFNKVALLEKHKFIHSTKKKFVIPIIFPKPSEKNSKNFSDCLSSDTNYQNQGLNLNNRQNLFKLNVKPQNGKVKRCQFCDKIFKDNEMCSAHEKTHKGETPYECRLCGKRFRSRPSLRQHRSVHSDKRLFSCKECKMRFKRKDTLNNHLRIHTGERPFKCKICGFAFKQRGDCIKHERNHRTNEVLLKEGNCWIQKEASSTYVPDSVGQEESAPKNSSTNFDVDTLWNEEKSCLESKGDDGLMKDKISQ